MGSDFSLIEKSKLFVTWFVNWSESSHGNGIYPSAIAAEHSCDLRLRTVR
jgi:hypothetical protein